MKNININGGYRPLFHFTALKNWINDPNGFSYYNGYYHLFYQYNPKGIEWGNMSWGHAISKDLIYWDHMDVAMYPDQSYDIDGVFSGSAVESEGNHLLYYTGVKHEGDKLRQVQCLASSSDGINYIKHSNNPILEAGANADPFDFRDPKLWDVEGQRYMIVASNQDGNGKAIVYQSNDGIEFETMVEFTKENTGHMWECPDLFDVNNQWLLIFSAMGIENDFCENMSYIAPAIFKYDGSKTEVLDYEIIDHSPEFYAPQTMCDLKGRRIMIGWLRMDKPIGNEPWVGMMTLPREILWQDQCIRYQVIEEAFENKEILYSNSSKINVVNPTIDSTCEGHYIFSIDHSNVIELKASFNAEKSFSVSNGCHGGLVIEYDALSKQVFVANGYASPVLEGDMVELQIIIDRSVVEVFINNGRYVISKVFVNKEARSILCVPNIDGIKILTIAQL